jgi:hypothetical protein
MKFLFILFLYQVHQLDRRILGLNRYIKVEVVGVDDVTEGPKLVVPVYNLTGYTNANAVARLSANGGAEIVPAMVQGQ